jgi:hypothetical protein
MPSLNGASGVAATPHSCLIITVRISLLTANGGHGCHQQTLQHLNETVIAVLGPICLLYPAAVMYADTLQH